MSSILPVGLKRILRRRRRKSAKGLKRRFGQATSWARVYPPQFIVGGVQRGGTSSLYQYLARHPAVGAGIYKEIHFFDDNFDRGPSWYRSHFPTKLQERGVRRREGRAMVTGEASPYYVFHPFAARRIAQTLPDVRTILMLRDPVERAYSHYLHEVALGLEPLSFAEALDAEPRRLEGEAERLLADPRYRSFNHRHFSYVARGMYVEQVERWLEAIPRDRVLFVRSEDFAADPDAGLQRVLAYVGLAPFSLGEYPRVNASGAGRKPPMDPGIRDRLSEAFAEPNRRLARLLGPEFSW